LKSTVEKQGNPVCGSSQTEMKAAAAAAISEGTIRLVGGPTPYEGRVEIRLSETDEWGTICDTDWDMDAAEVVCRMLEFGKPMQAIPDGQFGDADSGNQWVDNIDCTGN